MPAQGTPTGSLVGGTSTRNPVLQGYVFQSGIHKPEHSNILSYKYPQFYATALLERLGNFEGVSQDVYSWNIIDRTRKGGTVSSVTNGTTDTATFEITEFDFTSTNPGYLIVGDTIRLESGEIGRVTASVVSTVLTNKQKVTVQRQKTAANGALQVWSTTLLNNTMKFGHVASSFGEGSSAPIGRLHLPTEEWNSLTTIRRSFSISGSELTNKTYLGDGASWYWTNEDIEMKEFAKDRELAIMFGELSGQTGTLKSSRGVYSYVKEYGNTNVYAAATGITEDDLQEMIKDLLKEGCSDDLYALAGADAIKDIQNALRDYAIAGAQDFGKGVSEATAGLNFQSYFFMGKRIHFAYYELFDDDAVLPTPAAVSATVYDFSKTVLFLDMGTDSGGRSLINLKYKEHDGISRKFVHAYETGMVNAYGAQGGQVSSGDDKFTIHLLSEIGVEHRLPNRCGILTATS
jgi:hypothetical protein